MRICRPLPSTLAERPHLSEGQRKDEEAQDSDRDSCPNSAGNYSFACGWVRICSGGVPAPGSRAWMSERAGHLTSPGTKPPSGATSEGTTANTGHHPDVTLTAAALRLQNKPTKGPAKSELIHARETGAGTRALQLRPLLLIVARPFKVAPTCEPSTNSSRTIANGPSESGARILNSSPSCRASSRPPTCGLAARTAVYLPTRSWDCCPAISSSTATSPTWWCTPTSTACRSCSSPSTSSRSSTSSSSATMAAAACRLRCAARASASPTIGCATCRTCMRNTNTRCTAAAARTPQQTVSASSTSLNRCKTSARPASRATPGNAARN